MLRGFIAKIGSWLEPSLSMCFRRIPSFRAWLHVQGQGESSIKVYHSILWWEALEAFLQYSSSLPLLNLIRRAVRGMIIFLIVYVHRAPWSLMLFKSTLTSMTSETRVFVIWYKSYSQVHWEFLPRPFHYQHQGPICWVLFCNRISSSSHAFSIGLRSDDSAGQSSFPMPFSAVHFAFSFDWCFRILSCSFYDVDLAQNRSLDVGKSRAHICCTVVRQRGSP